MLIGGAQLDNPAAPLSDHLRFGLQTKPGEVALLSAVRSLSWSELEEASSGVAAGYLGLGLEPGDRVASLMPNRVDLVVHYLACFKAGLIATPLNYRYTAAEIDHAVGVSGARVLLAHVERAEDVAASELAGGLDLGTIAYRDAEPLPQGNEEPAAAEPGWDHDFGTLLAAEPLPHDSNYVDPVAPAVIFFTSGSTGPAKGVTRRNAPSQRSCRLWRLCAPVRYAGTTASSPLGPRTTTWRASHPHRSAATNHGWR